MHEGISYMDDIDVYYYHCHTDGKEIELIKDKWYKITCLLNIPKLPIHKNIYFVPHPRLEEFLRYNPERLIDIEPICYEEVQRIISQNANNVSL